MHVGLVQSGHHPTEMQLILPMIILYLLSEKLQSWHKTTLITDFNLDRYRTAIYLTLLCLGIHVYSKYRIV